MKNKSKNHNKIPKWINDLLKKPTQSPVLKILLSKKDLIKEFNNAYKRIEDYNKVALELSLHTDLSLFPVFNKFLNVLNKNKIKRDGMKFDSFYNNFLIPKKNAAKRLISSPSIELKALQKCLLQLLYKEDISNVSTGFVKGKNIVLNATPHVKKSIVINVDIKNFFSSTRFIKIKALLSKLKKTKLNHDAIIFFSQLCSYKECLPTGAPTSPVLSNLLLNDFDKTLLAFCKNNQICYTRYADDLTFSGQNAKPKKIINYVEDLLKSYGYKLDPKKTNIFKNIYRQKVTGLVVNKKVNIPKPIRKRLRAAIHYLNNNKKPHWNNKDLHLFQLKGHLSFYKMVNPASSFKLIEEFNKIPNNKIIFKNG